MLEQNGSRKKRRLSPIENPVQQPLATTSRIKAKQNIATSRVQDGPSTPAASETTNPPDKVSFASLNVSPWLIASLASMEIKKPTGIQKACIPEILKGRDCIGGSRTGTGKTVAFSVPILQKWSEDPCGIFALMITYVLYHTHEVKRSILIKPQPYQRARYSDL
jgi:ATP-dependent RNA helicase DDX49/DBP8